MTTISLTTNKKNNVNLVITPCIAKTPLTESVVYEFIEASEYSNLLIVKANIKNAIAELSSQLKALQPGAKGEDIIYEILTRTDAVISFKIDSDEMSATAEITPALGGKSLTPQNIVDEARKASISRGFIKKTIIALAKEAEVNSLDKETSANKANAVIAKGRLAANGKNTQISPLVESAQSRILRPKKRDDGSVDMRDLGDIICVKVGDPLIERIPYTKGEDGFTVTGLPLTPEPGEDLELKQGEGTEFCPKNSNILISKLVGLPKIINNGMEVDEVYQRKDVDVATGHIKFKGSVIISGDIKEGMKVIASGDITVAGFVESAYLEAGGDITIQKGIIGRKQELDENSDINTMTMSAVLNANGNIFATYSQYAEINCKGDLRIENQLMHNIVNIEKGLWVGKEESANGKLIGGHIQAVESVKAGIIGATSGSKTFILFEKRIIEFKNGIKKAEEEIEEETKKAKDIKLLIDKLKSLPKKVANEETLNKVITTFQHHIENIKVFGNEKNLAEHQLQEYIETVFVEATEKIYHGVEVKIADFKEKTQREHGPTRMFYKERKIHLEPIVNS